MKHSVSINMLFPTLVLTSHSPVNPQDLQYCYQVKEQHQSVDKSNKRGYQSPLLDIPFTLPLQRLVDNILKDFTTKQTEHHKQWINVNPTGAYNQTHTHPQSDYSIVYYLKNDDVPIRFNHPESHAAYNTIAFLHKKVEEQLLIAPQVKISPQPGDLYIFPAYLPHSVDENTTPNDRVTVAWNVSLKL